MKPLLLLSLLTLLLLPACTSSGDQALDEEKRLYLAEFYLNQGAPYKAVQEIEKIKPDSRHYPAAQLLLERAEGGDAQADIGDPYLY